MFPTSFVFNRRRAPRAWFHTRSHCHITSKIIFCEVYHENFSFPACRRFQKPRRGSRQDHGRGRRNAPSGRDGRAFRAQHEFRSRRHQSDKTRFGYLFRRASDDRAARTLYRQIHRGGRRRRHHPLREHRKPRRSAERHPRGGQKSGACDLARHPRRRDLSPVAAGRHDPCDDGLPRLRRAKTDPRATG